jgi:hypothetical protein
LKDRLSRLPEAVRRCVAERVERRARQAAEERIHEQAALLDEARGAAALPCAGLRNTAPVKRRAGTEQSSVPRGPVPARPSSRP